MLNVRNILQNIVNLLNQANMQIDTCFKEIRLHAQNMKTILGLVINIVGVTFMNIW
jgi:hypothetical protein